ncbi:hypothetical protein BJV82DRAFT_635296 [Fennellomyces sp. T-0311]|nr:hypothetical protein BJV82DRAFT_635296 [Fennellomyces sp. T-0311]
MNGIVVAVSGHPHGSDEKLLGFLQRKSKQPWQPLDVRSEQGTMYISVGDDNSAAAITRMNNFNFGSAVVNDIWTVAMRTNVLTAPMQLSIQRVDSSNGNQQSAGPAPGGRSNALEEFLQERWNSQLGFLNLDELPQTKHPITVVITRLLSVAKNLFGNSLATISFARNSLWSVKPLRKLPELFPMLQNLSIQDNEIAEFRSLDDFANKFTHLTELMLMGNPIQKTHDIQRYQSEVARRFPSVQMLDQQPVGNTAVPSFGAASSPAGFGTPPPSNVPETRGNFYDQTSSQQATEDLLSQYFPLFDSNRVALADLYHEQQSFFSVTLSGNTPYARNTWGQAPRMVVGSANIMQRLAALPPTMHDLTPANIVVDAIQTTIPNNVVLNISIHGQFKEATGANGEVYSFDRTMIVAPAQPGSRAQMAGWRYIILQDSLIVRN